MLARPSAWGHFNRGPADDATGASRQGLGSGRYPAAQSLARSGARHGVPWHNHWNRSNVWARTAVSTLPRTRENPLDPGLLR